MRKAALLLGLLLLMGGTAGADRFTGAKLGLIPGLWPWERRALSARVVPLLKQRKDIRPQLLEAGVSSDVVKHLTPVPPGPLLKERYAHGLVLHAKGLSDKQSALFARLVPSIDAAQRALWTNGKKLVKGIADKALRKQVETSHKQQIQAIEVRFWRVVMYALTRDQQISIKRLYPETYNNPPNIVGHVYQLPGLTPSQMSRLRALVTEYQSESAADSAEGLRLVRLLADKKLPAEEKERLQKARFEVVDRNARRIKRVVETSIPIYSPEQLLEIESWVPMVSPQDRGKHPSDLLKGLALRPEQRKQAQALGRKLQAVTQKNQKALRDRMGTMGDGEFGSDAPQAMTMQTMQANARAGNMAAMEAVGRELVLSVLDPQQVANWVVSP